MKTLTRRRAALTLGAIAVLALSSGVVPNTPGNTSTAQAAAEAQRGGSYGAGQYYGKPRPRARLLSARRLARTRPPLRPR